MIGAALGIDLGTSGLRVAVVDPSGDVIALNDVLVEPMQRRNPAVWWESATQAIVTLGHRVDLSHVRAIAVDGTSGTILPVNARGHPLAPASLYNDRAEAADVATVAAFAAKDSAARGVTSPMARLLRWRTLPGVARVLHEADWLAGRFCGRFDTTDANNALKTGFDPRVDAWPEWALELAGDLLPSVIASGTRLDQISPRIARELKLSSAVAVVSGTTDGCAAFLATGAAETGDAVTSLGSTLTVKLLSDKPVFSPLYGVYSHLLRGRWLAGGASNSGGAALRRHFDQFALTQLSDRIDGETDSPLDYYPLPATGERFPWADPTMVSCETPRPVDDVAFLHGLLQGIARIEAQGYRRLTELGAPPLRSVRTVGGGASNPAWAAIRARGLGVPFAQTRATEAAVGTASLALAGLSA